MHEWFVAGAIIESESLGGDSPTGESALLLVENERHGGTRDWSTPGGVIDSGESPRAALEREVLEETGLVVLSWSDLLYQVVVEARDLGWTLHVEVHRARAVEGELNIGADPDGIVVGANWADSQGCLELLTSAPPWVSEPLLEWVDQRFTDPRSFEYSLWGTSLDDLRVERLSR